MNKEIKELDERGYLIYFKSSWGAEHWFEYDKNNNIIYYKNSFGMKNWREYDKNNNLIHFKALKGLEFWSKYDKNNKQIEISKKEFEQIKRKKYREIVNNSKLSRFELMDI